MRAAVALGAWLVGAGCGRLGFDSSGDGGTAGDDGGDASGSDGDGGPNGIERCNGLDDDNDTVIDEDACAEGCRGLTRLGRGYMLCEMNVTWFQARDICAAAGLQLVRIDDAAENAFVRAALDPLTNPQGWIGANDIEVEDTWRWLDGTQFWQGNQTGSPVGGRFSAWQSNQPDDQQGVQDCAESIPMALWLDEPCEAALDNPFCEAN